MAKRTITLVIEFDHEIEMDRDKQWMDQETIDEATPFNTARSRVEHVGNLMVREPFNPQDHPQILSIQLSDNSYNYTKEEQ